MLNLTTDAMAGNCSLDDIELATYPGADRVLARYRHLIIDTHFQPIFSLSHRRPVGYEALMRASRADGTPVAPVDVFAGSRDERGTVYLDRLCRDIHVRNFRTFARGSRWLFLNVNPTVVIRGREHGPYFESMLQRHGISPHEIVVEITEENIDDETLLEDAVCYYKQLGCLVAIDDFGAGHSNFDRIWRIRPDIVKLDRSMIAQASTNPSVRRVIPNLVSLIHESGSLALMEGVETGEEALIAMDSGIDFVQGYYFAPPSPAPTSDKEYACTIPRLCEDFRRFAEDERTRYQREISKYAEVFTRCAAAFSEGITLEQACGKMLFHSRTERCYVLDEHGRQISGNLTPPQRGRVDDPRFLPLRDASGATWFRRHYFRRAISAPGEVHVSRPYLSLTSATMCVTLSTMVTVAGQLRVVCCDLDWQGP